MIEMNVLNSNDEWHKWWWNFTNHYKSIGIDMDNDEEITRMLKEWRAIDAGPDSTLFYFENEQDHTMFMLRWA